jgi:predicted nucleotidyltransferase/uncharacterized protein YuzE
MKITYDRDADALYIAIVEGDFPRRTVEAGPDLVLDYGPDGRVTGVELLRAGRHLGGNGAPRIELDGIEGHSANIHAGSKFESLDDLRAKWKPEILRIAAVHGVQNIRVFGSFARGDTNADSDLDLLVGMEPRRTYLDFVGFWQDVEEALGFKVDVVSDGGVNRYMKDKIYHEAVPL